MLDLSIILSKEERLLNLKVYETIDIIGDNPADISRQANNWRARIRVVMKDNKEKWNKTGETRRIRVRLCKDNITRVVRTA